MDDAQAHRETVPLASVAGAPGASGAASIPRQPRSYLWILLGLLVPATIFEGYDITIFHLCTPDIAATFHLGNQAIGVIASIVRFGTVLSFLVISCSDRVGRKPVISVTVLGYGLFTLFTGLSRGLFTFTLFQSCSQVFLASEFGMAIIIISEEFPDELRGRAIAGSTWRRSSESPWRVRCMVTWPSRRGDGAGCICWGSRRCCWWRF